MKGLGIIAEYNPFHHGHEYHIQESKRILNPDYTVAVMSGNWVQRGEPALIDKWTRTQAALEAGIDLVVELPFVFATQSASEFTFGGISLLNELQTVSYQSFGSESNDLSSLEEAAKVLYLEPETFKHTLKEKLAHGMTYSKALSETLGLSNRQSNDILGIEYIKQHMKLKTNIKYTTVKRVGSDYKEDKWSGKLSSASAIRKLILSNELEEAEHALPKESSELVRTAWESNQVVGFTHLEKYILYKYRTAEERDITDLIEYEQGLESRIKEAALDSTSLAEFLGKLKTKRYTRTRLNRLLVHGLLNLKKEDLAHFNQVGPPYIRILGMNTLGKSVLKKLSKQTNLPIIVRPGRELKQLPDFCTKCFNWENKSTALYNLLRNKTGREEYQRAPIIAKSNTDS